MDACLYDPDHGFYTTGGGAGRRGDFITSPEVGPLFGAVMAGWLDSVWTRLGRPRDFTVVEAGAGNGSLARSVLAAGPACLDSGRYATVERSARLRAGHPEGVEPSCSLPGDRFTGAILANELLDNLAFRLLVAEGGAWRAVRVAEDDGRLVEEVAEVVRPPVPVEPVDGARIAVQDEAAAWVAEAVSLLDAGSLLVADYCTTTARMASATDCSWLRTYAGHERGGPALWRPGGQDITAEVAVDQLPGGAEASDQAGFLRSYGIDDLVAEGRRTWSERAHLGDLEAVRARSRATEAEALCDPAGLGGFGILEWAAGP